MQLINIVTLGSTTGKGGFFPNGLYGAINSSAGLTNSGNGLADFPTGLASQVRASHRHMPIAFQLFFLHARSVCRRLMALPSFACQHCTQMPVCVSIFLVSPTREYALAAYLVSISRAHSQWRM